MLSTRWRRRGMVALTTVLAALVVAAPATDAKKKRGTGVGGKVSITIPGFNPDTGQSLASGRVKAKRNCDGLRLLRFAYFDASGIPTSSTLTSVVTNPNGSFLVALPEPYGDPPFTLRIFVEPRKTRFKGRGVKCKPIRSRAIPVPQSSGF